MSKDLKYEFAHPGIKVSNLEASIEFYKKNFGFKEVERKDKPDLEIKLAFLQLRESYLELIEPHNKIMTITLKPLTLTELLRTSKAHIAISTNNLSFAYKKLKENNVEFATNIINEKFFFCKDPDGFLIEIRQRK